MKNKVLSVLQDFAAPGSRLLAAVSGGMDSMVLLDILVSVSDRYDITCAHFNHQLRGEESRRDEQFVREYCEEKQIPLVVSRGDVTGYASEHHVGLEEAARTLRYSFLTSVPGIDWIVTAHNGDDNLETILMHLVRGTGLHGLGGIAPVRERILRPMLQIPRADIARYASERQVPFVTDSSNETDLFFRNRMRHSVIPILREENPRIVENTAELSRILRAEDDYLQAQSALGLDRVCSGGALDRSAFLALPEALQPRVLALFLRRISNLSSIHIRSALSLIRAENPSAALDLPGDFRLRRNYDMLVLEHSFNAAPLPAPTAIEPWQAVRFGSWLIQCLPDTGQYTPDREYLILDRSVLDRPMTLRCPQPGDRIHLTGGTRKISRMLIDLKVPKVLRASLPILMSGDEVAAVIPLKAAAAFRKREGYDSVMLSAIRMEEEK
ncbi:MAG: tRNA lysidine(34) synthetase TilS [Oscillospiraceae bacterium]|nr:tRNA lysidine(34) synthetase TilS [Oscillospiraceae bacterium]